MASGPRRPGIACCEVDVHAGDLLCVPRCWWHQVQGASAGLSAAANFFYAVHDTSPPRCLNSREQLVDSRSCVRILKGTSFIGLTG